MAHHQHDAGAVSARVDFQFPGNTDEPGVIVSVVLNLALQGAQPVQFPVDLGADGGDIRAIAFGDFFCRYRRILHLGHHRPREFLQIFLTLGDGLGMGENFPDVLFSGSRLGQQGMVDLHPDAADDVEMIFHHQVIDRIDGTGGGVLDGKNAVIAFPFLDGLEYAPEVLLIRDLGHREESVTGLLGVSPLHALTRHLGAARKYLRGIAEGIPDPVHGFRFLVKELVLMVLAHFHDRGEQNLVIIGQILVGIPEELLDFLPLPDRVEDTHPMLQLVFCNAFRHPHSLLQLLQQGPVDPVDLLSVIL